MKRSCCRRTAELRLRADGAVRTKFGELVVLGESFVANPSLVYI